MFRNVEKGYSFSVCYSCTNDKQILGQGWYITQYYDCKLEMKAKMLMYATSAVMHHNDVYIYNVIAGKP